MSLNERILADLRRTYLSAVQEMALSPEGSNGHRRGESLAASTSHTVFSMRGAGRLPFRPGRSPHLRREIRKRVVPFPTEHGGGPEAARHA